jgi:hypothetical protein
MGVHAYRGQLRSTNVVVELSQASVPSQPATETSQNTVHLQPSSTSLSSQEVGEPVVGPITLPAPSASQKDAQQRKEATCGAAAVEDDTKPSALEASLAQFSATPPQQKRESNDSTPPRRNSQGTLLFAGGDSGASGANGRFSISSAVLGLLKEESDILEDEAPMSFLKPSPTFRKGPPAVLLDIAAIMLHEYLRSCRHIAACTICSKTTSGGQQESAQSQAEVLT